MHTPVKVAARLYDDLRTQLVSTLYREYRRTYVLRRFSAQARARTCRHDLNARMRGSTRVCAAGATYGRTTTPTRDGATARTRSRAGAP